MLGGYLKFPWNPRVEPFEGEHGILLKAVSCGAAKYRCSRLQQCKRRRRAAKCVCPAAAAAPAGHVVYTLNDEGLVQVQDQNWAKSAATALRESFTPTAGPSTDIVGL